MYKYILSNGSSKEVCDYSKIIMENPFPSLVIQKQLVAEAKKEEEIITANKKLIEIMERKIKECLNLD